ncbi:MAG: hypothetical protein AAFV53_24025 [Myxococcota bacterium]
MATSMMKIPLMALVIPLALMGCDQTGEEDPEAPVCGAPIAEAGGDIIVPIGDAVTLDGTESEWCSDTSDTLTFTWAFLQTPPTSAVDETSLSDNRTNTAITPVFTPDVQGDYVLGLSITDVNGDSDQDLVVVTAGSGNSEPIADCGGSYFGDVGVAVSVDGSDSYDPENRELTYSWSMQAPDCSELTAQDLSNDSTDMVTFVPDCGGQYEVSLVVADEELFSDPVLCVVNVGAINEAPIADAGPGGEIGGCGPNPYLLNGYASYDVNGDELNFEWSVISKPAGSAVTDASFTDRTAPNPGLRWDVDGTYTVQLQVNDGELYSSPDIVSFTVGDVNDNLGPVANAGEDQEFEITVTCTSSSYVWSCPTCPGAVADLDASGSFDPDGDLLSYEWSEATGLLQIDDNYSAITKARIPSAAATYRQANEFGYKVDLKVQDCAEESFDSMNIFYSCEGEK